MFTCSSFLRNDNSKLRFPREKRQYRMFSLHVVSGARDAMRASTSRQLRVGTASPRASKPLPRTLTVDKGQLHTYCRRLGSVHQLASPEMSALTQIASNKMVLTSVGCTRFDDQLRSNIKYCIECTHGILIEVYS